MVKNVTVGFLIVALFSLIALFAAAAAPSHNGVYNEALGTIRDIFGWALLVSIGMALLVSTLSDMVGVAKHNRRLRRK